MKIFKMYLSFIRLAIFSTVVAMLGIISEMFRYDPDEKMLRYSIFAGVVLLVVPVACSHLFGIKQHIHPIAKCIGLSVLLVLYFTNILRKGVVKNV